MTDRLAELEYEFATEDGDLDQEALIELVKLLQNRVNYLQLVNSEQTKELNQLDADSQESEPFMNKEDLD